jgi:hypothetical protein
VTAESTYYIFIDCGALGTREIVFHYTATPPTITPMMALQGEPGNPPDFWNVVFHRAMMDGINVLSYISESLLQDYAIEITTADDEGCLE